MTEPITCLIEITYIPKRGKGAQIREAIEDALDRLSEESLSPIVEGASIDVRYVKVFVP
jgi:hypothetical protein